MRTVGLYWPVIIVFLFGAIGFSYENPENLPPDFFNAEGIRVLHSFADSTDLISDQEIIELKGKDGLPIWFARHIFKDVCISGKCRMVRLWLFWDGVGNYHGFQLLEHEPLTKSDHTQFEAADYKKLDEILSDSLSILKDFKQEDLVVIPDSIDNPYELDGYTAATQPALSEVVVKDAVYTCHTLWHTVYGNTQEKIRSLLIARLDQSFLEAMFKTGDVSKKLWVVKMVDQHPEYHAHFYLRFIECMQSGDNLLAESTLSYFRGAMLDDILIQTKLVETMPALSLHQNTELIWKLVDCDLLVDENIVRLLEHVQAEELPVGFLNLIYRLIKPEHLEDPQVVEKLADFSQAEDVYIRNMTKRLLQRTKE